MKITESKSGCLTFVMQSFWVTATLLLSACVHIVGCGGGSGGNASQPSITNVSVSCSSSSLLTNQTSTCTASVAGTGNYSSTVKWSATGGTVTSSGVFTPSLAGTAIITATSTQDTTKSGSATVTVNAATTITSVALGCSPASIETNQTSACTPTVVGTGNFSSSVTWSVIPSGIGTMNNNGLFTPATTGTANITATSTQDTSKSGSATVTVTTPPTITSVAALCSPSSLLTNQTSACAATVTGTGNFTKSVNWSVSPASIGSVSSAGVFTPSSAGTATVTATSTQDTTQRSSATVTVLPPHRIGVRTTDSGFAEFYDRTLGTTFVPRGNNYVRLADQTKADGSPTYYHSTFNVGLYDSTRSETSLAAMQNSGYNTVRVFLNGCCQNGIGNPKGGLSSGYISNLVDFVKRARNHSIYVIFTQDYLPDLGGYENQLGACTQFSDFNTLNLCAEGVEATKSFFQDLVVALVNQQAPMDAILAFELRNEYFYGTDQIPLSLTSGTVTAADGKTYDMADPVSRQQMMDNGLTYFTDQVRSVIVALDPTALVTVGFFWPQTPNPTRIGDPRVISIYPAMANSTADFIDIHSYAIPGELTFAQMAENFGFTGYQQQKPVLEGEFGAFKNQYPDITLASSILSDWQRQACPYSVKGWLLWTWDTEEPEQVPALWSAMSGDGSINDALSPRTNPDPCQ